LMKNLGRIWSAKFTAKSSDVILGYVPTQGVTSKDLPGCAIIDTGGNKKQRCLWETPISKATAVIFVAAPVRFDEKTLLQEELSVWDFICNHPNLTDVPIFLFFNQEDRLAEKLLRVSLSDYCVDYYGDNSLNSVKAYFDQLFLSINRTDRAVRLFWTSATDVGSMSNVLKECFATKRYFSSPIVVTRKS